jgi:hypothetical protein
MRRLGNLCRIWLLSAALGAVPAVSQPFHNVAIRPAAPTIADDIVLEVTADVNAHCGSALTLAWFSPESTEIALFVVPVLTDLSCPASEELFTFEFLLGKLAAGSHTVGLVTPDGEPFFLPLLSFEVSADPADHATLHERFEVRVEWQDFSGGSGIGRPVPNSTDDSALLWFFHPDNWEILIKVLDGCALNGHWWILGSGATNVAFTLEVLDRETGLRWTYDNSPGHPAGTFFNTSFSTCP